MKNAVAIALIFLSGCHRESGITAGDRVILKNDDPSVGFVNIYGFKGKISVTRVPDWTAAEFVGQAPQRGARLPMVNVIVRGGEHDGLAGSIPRAYVNLPGR